jgi:hypothetical protein
MNTRRGFITTVLGLVAGVCSGFTLRQRSVTTPIVMQLPQLLEDPIVYKGEDPTGQRYHSLGDGRMEVRKGMRLFVNDTDMTDCCYECLTGDNGWANLIYKEDARTFRTFDYKVIHYSIRGKVEWRPKNTFLYGDWADERKIA